jgi:hypothetical protein
MTPSLVAGIFYIVVGIIVWLLCAVCAALAGPKRYATRLFFLTLVFMGPMGIAAALIMTVVDDNGPRSKPTRRAPIPAARRQVDRSLPPLKIGDRVKVDDLHGEYNGGIGVVDEITDEKDGYNIYVAFGGDDKTHAFGRDEIRTL